MDELQKAKQAIRGEVVVFLVGVGRASACAPSDLHPNEVADAANRSHPTDVGPWTPVIEESFPCDADESRRHWLLEC